MSKNPLTLNDYCEFIVDCLHKTAPIEDSETGYYSIRTPDIGRGRLILENANRVSKETYEKWTIRAVPQAGDLILAREAPVGNIGIVPKNVNVCCGQRTVHLRPDSSKIDPEYLVYLMNGDEIQGKIKGYSQGVTVAHLNMEDIRALILPELPPMAVQRRIADILSAYDDLIENNKRRIRTLEGMAQVIYQEWFGKVDKESLPKGWTLKSLGDVAQEVRRNVHPNDIDTETPYFGLEHLPRKSLALSEWGKAEDVQSTKLAFKKGEILFGKIRPYFHKVGVAPLDGVASSDTIIIAPKSPEFFGLTLSYVFSEEFVNHATKISQGTKMPRANWGVLVKYPILIPPKLLLEQFNQTINGFVEMIQNLLFRNRNLRQTRDLLLPRLVSGEIEVTS
jgi:type I restriction enzyme S subunit